MADDGVDHCDLCLISERRIKVLRFSLVYGTRNRVGSRTTRGAGAVLLCEECWQRGPAKRRRSCQTS